MHHIVVDNQQAKLIFEATESVEIRDQEGRHLGYAAHGFADEDIALANDRLASDQSRHTTQQVLDHLQSLDGLSLVDS
jgi:hypothetical protein